MHFSGLVLSHGDDVGDFSAWNSCIFIEVSKSHRFFGSYYSNMTLSMRQMYFMVETGKVGEVFSDLVVLQVFFFVSVLRLEMYRG